LGLLVVAEALALIYDNRKEALIAEAERSVADQRRRGEEETNKRHQAETEALQQQLADAQKSAEFAAKQAIDANRRTTTLEAKSAPRTLSEAQRYALADALKPFAGNKVSIIIDIGDIEAKSFASQFVNVFREAGWDCGASDGITQGAGSIKDAGIQVRITAANAHAGNFPRGTDVLLNTLVALGLTKPNIYAAPDAPPGQIEVRVGPKER